MSNVYTLEPPTQGKVRVLRRLSRLSFRSLS